MRACACVCVCVWVCGGMGCGGVYVGEGRSLCVGEAFMCVEGGWRLEDDKI